MWDWGPTVRELHIVCRQDSQTNSQTSCEITTYHKVIARSNKLSPCMVGAMRALAGNLQEKGQLLENVFADPKGFGIAPDGRYRYQLPGFSSGTAAVS